MGMTKETNPQDRVIILMSVYNGQRYIREQICSILDQDFQGLIELLIRDDGSADRTDQEIEQISLPDNRAIELIQGENIGVQRSFLNLMDAAPEAGYYFFADQDDIWDPDKVRLAVMRMKQAGKNPVVYCSNFRLSDEKLKITESASLKQAPDFTPLRVLFYNEIPGCTIGFNDSFLRIIRRTHLKNCMMHDSLVLSLAAHCAEIVYDPVPRITHRIHEANAVGSGHKKIVWNQWFREKLRLLFQKEDYDLSEMAERFLAASEGMEKRSYVSDLELLRDYKKSFGNTLRLLRHQDSQNIWWDRTTMSVCCRIIFHIY